jgi:hypothetical protein
MRFLSISLIAFGLGMIVGSLWEPNKLVINVQPVKIIPELIEPKPTYINPMMLSPYFGKCKQEGMHNNWVCPENRYREQ